MNILSVDTALGRESCAISSAGKLVAFSAGTENSLQAEKLFFHIDKVLAEAGMSYNDIDYFAVDLGPGSFTGIRIGLSAITAICQALNKKLLGISSLEALAYKLYLKDNSSAISAAIDAGRSECYVQNFVAHNSFEAQGEAELFNAANITTANIGNMNFCKINDLPDARDISTYAFYVLNNKKADFSRKSPIYIRKPDAKIKVKNV